MDAILKIKGLEKHFTLHTQNGATLKVLNAVDLTVQRGEIVALCGPSGVGKSSLLKSLYGTYRSSGGCIEIDHNGQMTDITTAAPREIIDIRRTTLGYVSQFLRVIPRVSTLDIVAEAAIQNGADEEVAQQRAVKLLELLRIPSSLHDLSPLTFSGGEQQRVNIARAISAPRPVMLFDEPTASLDPENRETVLSMISELKDNGAAIVGIFHNLEDRSSIGAREFALTPIKRPEYA